MNYLEQRRKHIEDGRPLAQKKNYSIPKVSKKRQDKINAEKIERGDDDTELVKWFKNRIKQLTGHCNECGCKLETKIYQYAIHSVCHILPKRETMCPSVKTHPHNFIELCPDHHTMFDNISWDEKEKWGCWPEILDRLVMIEPCVALDERRHLPKQLLDYIEKHKAF